MAELTREEVEMMVKRGESLPGMDLRDRSKVARHQPNRTSSGMQK
jgi:hypothetical protein